MALFRSTATIFRLINNGVDVPRLPKKSDDPQPPREQSLGRTSAEMPPSPPKTGTVPQP